METTSPVVVTSADLAPITASITGNLDVLLPVGITIMAVMIGVSLIPWVKCLIDVKTGDIKPSLIDLEPKGKNLWQQGAKVMLA